MYMYADDTQLYFSFPYKELDGSVDKINSDLESILCAAKDHGLSLNAGKTNIMLFGNRNHCSIIGDSDIPLTMDNTQLTVVHEARNLGLVFDSPLRFHTHVSNCIKSAYASLRMLYPHRHDLGIDVKIMLCQSLVLSKFNYCLPVYGPCMDAADKYRIQKVQNSCLRFIFGIRKFDRISHKLRDANWLNMENRYLLQTASLIHSIKINKKPDYLYENFITHENMHRIDTRHKTNFVIPSHVSARYERSFTYVSSTVYNSVPENFKSYNLYKFKTYFRNFLQDRQNQQN